MLGDLAPNNLSMANLLTDQKKNPDRWSGFFLYCKLAKGLVAFGLEALLRLNNELLCNVLASPLANLYPLARL
jgi:hypothetical protein